MLPKALGQNPEFGPFSGRQKSPILVNFRASFGTSSGRLRALLSGYSAASSPISGVLDVRYAPHTYVMLADIWANFRASDLRRPSEVLFSDASLTRRNMRLSVVLLLGHSAQNQRAQRLSQQNREG